MAFKKMIPTLASLLLAACSSGGGSYSPAPYNPPASSSNQNISSYMPIESRIPATNMTMPKYVTSLLVGETYQFEAKVEPANATDRNLIWESSNTSVASVSSTGYVTALSKGTTVISAHQSELTIKVTLTVTESLPIIKASLPTTCSYYVSRVSNARTTVLIKSMTVGTGKNVFYPNGVFMISLMVQKTYDIEGPTGTGAAAFQYAVYSETGSLVDHNKIYESGKWVNEEWKINIAMPACESGKTYTIRFSDYI